MRAGYWLSLLRAVVNLRAVVDIEDVDNAAVLVDPVDDGVDGRRLAGEHDPSRAAGQAQSHLPGLAVSRSAHGFMAVERGTGRTITADTVTELENQLARF
jgi:hypothetical protein